MGAPIYQGEGAVFWGVWSLASIAVAMCLILKCLYHKNCQGAYNSGKPANLREFVNSGKLREFERYSGNFCRSDAIFFVTQPETHNKPTFPWLQWYLYELLVVDHLISVDMII